MAILIPTTSPNLRSPARTVTIRNLDEAGAERKARRGRPLERLAEQRAMLEEIAQRQRELERLAAKMGIEIHTRM